MSDPIGITSFFLGLMDRAIRLWGWISKRPGVTNNVGPPRALSFVPQRHTWYMGGVANEPAMSLMSDWWITNTTETHVYILRAELRFRHHFRKKVINQMQIMEKGTADALGEIRLLFWIVPPVCNEDQEFSASVVMIDNFNRRHKVGRVIFRGPKARPFPD